MKILNKSAVVSAVAFSLILGFAGFVIAAVVGINLGNADGFAILAGSTVTNTGTSAITGDLGLSPGSSVTGFPPGTLAGTQHISDGAANRAKDDLVLAYNAAAGETPVTTIATELGGTTKNAGIYSSASGTFGITGTLTLDAQGDPNAIFVFKTATTLITAGSSHVSLINGAQACNVYWQVGSSATLGTSSVFEGNIFALTAITLTTSASVEGRLLARNGAVTLDTNVVTKPSCTTPPPAPTPVSSAPSNGGFNAPLPLINVTKVPTPLALPAGPGSVTYNYVVTNIGVVPMYGIWVRDNKCDAVTYVSGDTNKDLNLDMTESWIYQCTKIVSQTETNIVTAHGSANGWDGYDTASATVVVGASIVPPLIHLVKVPNIFVLPAGGGVVTYSYSVTNPGTVPLTDVSITDDKCTGLPGRVAGHPGDINQNGLLDPGETFHFTCESSLTQTTTNVGTAEGHANGLTAIDFSSATVVVGTPTLPVTSIGPVEDNNSWLVVLLGGVLVSLLSFGITRKKNIISK